MTIKKTITVELSNRDQERLEGIFDFLEDFKDEDACDKIECYECPFRGFCDNEIEGKDDFVEFVKNLLDND